MNFFDKSVEEANERWDQSEEYREQLLEIAKDYDERENERRKREEQKRQVELERIRREQQIRQQRLQEAEYIESRLEQIERQISS